MGEETGSQTAPKHPKKRPQALYYRKDSWMGSPILVSPNFGGSSNGPRLGNAKVHPLVAAGKEGSTVTRTRASAGGESLELSSTSRRVGVATYRLE